MSEDFIAWVNRVVEVMKESRQFIADSLGGPMRDALLEKIDDVIKQKPEL
jgi:hypothetical protein